MMYDDMHECDDMSMHMKNDECVENGGIWCIWRLMMHVYDCVWYVVKWMIISSLNMMHDIMVCDVGMDDAYTSACTSVHVSMCGH